MPMDLRNDILVITSGNRIEIRDLKTQQVQQQIVLGIVSQVQIIGILIYVSDKEDGSVLAVVNQSPKFSIRKIDCMSANPKVQVAIFQNVNWTNPLKFDFETTTPRDLVSLAVMKIGCKPIHLTSRPLKNTSTYRLSMLFAFEEKETLSLPKAKLQVPKKILEDVRVVSYEGYHIYAGTKSVNG